MSGPLPAPPGDPPDLNAELAGRLGLAVETFIDLFGAGWTASSTATGHDFDGDPSGGEGWPVTPWAIAGVPPQLMLRVFGHGVFAAAPRGVWAHGSHGLAYEPDGQVYLPLAEVASAADVLARILARRRRSFRYCRYCRGLTPPEERHAPDTCMGCAAVLQGVVH